MKYKLVLILLLCILTIGGCKWPNTGDLDPTENSTLHQSGTEESTYQDPTENSTSHQSGTEESTYQSEPAEQVPQEPWYNKIKLGVRDRWSLSVIETDESFYYVTNAGVYRYSKLTGEDVLVVAENAYGLLVRDNMLYYNTGHAVKALDFNTGEISLLWDETMLSSMPDLAAGYYGVNDFQIADDRLYLATTGISAIYYNILQGTTEEFLEDFSCAVISPDACYYIDHAQRTFSIYRMAYDTGEVRLLRGEGITEPSTDLTRIDGLAMIGNSVYYTVRDACDIYRLDDDGEDELIFDGTANGSSWLYLVSSNSCDTFYFYEEDDLNFYVYSYNPSAGISKIFSAEHQGGGVDICITESAVFYQTIAHETVQYVALQKSVE